MKLQANQFLEISTDENSIQKILNSIVIIARYLAQTFIYESMTALDSEFSLLIF